MRVPMFEVFSGHFASGFAVWIETVEGLGNAADLMKNLAAENPGPYFVFSTEKRMVMAAIDTSRRSGLGTLPPVTRILLVEDFGPYRSAMVSRLDQCPGFRVVGAAEDGLAAVAQAQQFRPDVILMDIGLPKLNGLEAARQIGGLVPSTRIIFLTQETDVDVVKNAFDLGASGYVLKQDAGAELLAAIAAVLEGKQYASRGLDKGGFAPAKQILA
jgi:CheY-like chemotaxis protein